MMMLMVLSSMSAVSKKPDVDEENGVTWHILIIMLTCCGKVLHVLKFEYRSFNPFIYLIDIHVIEHVQLAMVRSVRSKTSILNN